MPQVLFTSALERHVPCPPQRVSGGTVREALEAAFTANPAVRGYVVDEQGTLRQHVNVFVDGEPVRDRSGLSDEVAAEAQIYVLQALSGG